MIILVKGGLINDVDKDFDECRVISREWFTRNNTDTDYYSTSYVSAILNLHDLDNTKIVIAEYHENVLRNLCYENICVVLISQGFSTSSVRQEFTEYGKYFAINLADDYDINSIVRMLSVKFEQHVRGRSSSYIFSFKGDFKIVSRFERKVNGCLFYCEVYDTGFVSYGYFDGDGIWWSVTAQEINDVLKLSTKVMPNINICLNGRSCGILEPHFNILFKVLGLCEENKKQEDVKSVATPISIRTMRALLYNKFSG